MPEQPAFDLAALLGSLTGAGNSEHHVYVIRVLAELLQDTMRTLREERAERLDLRRRVDKLTELLERARVAPRLQTAELEVSLAQRTIVDIPSASPQPLPEERLALDTPPDDLTPPGPGAPRI